MYPIVTGVETCSYHLNTNNLPIVTYNVPVSNIMYSFLSAPFCIFGFNGVGWLVHTLKEKSKNENVITGTLWRLKLIFIHFSFHAFHERNGVSYSDFHAIIFQFPAWKLSL